MRPLELTLRLGAAGAAIGMERQWHQHSAGLSTNVLVALGAALFVILGVMTPSGSSPTRIVSYVASGVGFHGAGAIMSDGLDVRGLNTAATLFSEVSWSVGWDGETTDHVEALADPENGDTPPAIAGSRT